MHREYTEGSEIDPMNAPQKTVFFKKSKSIRKGKFDDFQSKTKVEKSGTHEGKKSDEAHPNITSIDEENIDETSKKLVSIKNEIENAKKTQQITKQKLTSKAQSLKKAKSALTKTQKKLDDVLSAEFHKFESERLETIGKLSSKMAHDMRNSLTILQSQIELMKVKQQTHEDKVLAKSIFNMEEAISHIANQINDVLGFIRTPELRMISCDLKEIIKKSINEIKLPNGISIHHSIESCVLQCDVIKIRGIITNILQNAVQAIGYNGEVGQINITLEKDTDCVIITISDSGSGIPDENLEKIFDPMFTTKDEGTGLGLASSKQLLQMHNGSITVKNDPTTFTIKLPFTKSN